MYCLCIVRRTPDRLIGYVGQGRPTVLFSFCIPAEDKTGKCFRVELRNGKPEKELHCVYHSEEEHPGIIGLAVQFERSSANESLFAFQRLLLITPKYILRHGSGGDEFKSESWSSAQKVQQDIVSRLSLRFQSQN